MQLDEALNVLGAYGRYQVIVYLAISVFDTIPSIMHMSIMAFVGYEPNHRCKLPGNNSNLTVHRILVDGEWTIDKCHLAPYNLSLSSANSSSSSSGFYVTDPGVNVTSSSSSSSSSSSPDLVTCTDGWQYDPEPITASIVTDWDLVCDRNFLPETTQTIFNFGVMFGAIFFGFLSDKFGRKRPFVAALISQGIVGSLTSAAPDLYTFTAMRFIVGALEQGVNITGFIMATELFPPKQRTVMAVSHEFFWALGGAVLPGLAFLLRNWRHLQIAVSLPAILGVFLIWTIPESLVWLIAKGRKTEAEMILQKAARVNGKEIPLRCLHDDSPPDNAEGRENLCRAGKTPAGQHLRDANRTYTVLDLVRTPTLRKITICISGLWALNTMVYYGLSYNTPNLYGDMFVNFFIGQVVEIPSVIVTMWLIYRVGRRWPLCLFHVFGGLVCIASSVVPAKTASGLDLTWISVTFAMLGKFAINASFTIIYIYGPEIYPTVLRNTGAGVGSFAGRFGGIVYPYINYLSKMSFGSLGRQLPLVIFGILSVVGGFLALPLPETRHRPLPETIEDLEDYESFCRRRRKQRHSLDGDGGGDAKKLSPDGVNNGEVYELVT